MATTLSLTYAQWNHTDVKEFNANFERPIRWIGGDRFEIINAIDAADMAESMMDWAKRTHENGLRGSSRGHMVLRATAETVGRVSQIITAALAAAPVRAADADDDENGIEAEVGGGYGPGAY